MNGSKLFIDTNIVLYLLSGDKTLASLLNGKLLYVSFITQLELLSYVKNSLQEEGYIKEFLSECIVIDINESIKEHVINIKKKYNIKLPDAIIMASSMYVDLPIITADNGFKKLEEIDLLLYKR